jgi:probable F420-dependent oxidoreductase
LLGTGVCLITEHDPIVTAKSVASLDRLSGGRFLFGIGAGWNAEEMENHGTRYETRYQVMRERVLAMKAIWTQEEAAFHGRFVHFDPIWSYPKPMQRPHPPILLGGGTDHTLKRVVEFGDGWLPIATPGFHASDAVNRLRLIAAAAGRDPSTFSVTVFGAPPDATALAEYQQTGIQRALLEVPDLNRDEILRVIDKHASLAQRAI